MAEPMVQEGPLAGYFACTYSASNTSCRSEAGKCTQRPIHSDALLSGVVSLAGDTSAGRGLDEEASSIHPDTLPYF